ncbi:MAG: MBL fold metallo-hydrolase [Chloroflexi bacterium]|nr:MBL fold metallo-hydrolase [Chloroflexota bacterium]
MPVQAFTGVGPMDNNVYLIYDEEAKEALLADPAMQSEPIWEFIQQRALALKYIVNTHGHSDHCWNNAYFKEHAPAARFLIHQGDEPMLASLAQSGLRWGMKVAPSPPPDGYLEDGQALQVGGIAVEVLHTPGHTPGSSCLYVPGVVITGDTLFKQSIGRYDSPGGSLERLLASIRARLLVLPDETVVCPGHGPTSTLGDERENNPFLDEATVRRMGLL